MRARDLAQDFGSLRSKHFDSTESYLKAKHDYLSGCFGSYGKDSYSEHPIHIDYGFNVHIGSSFYSNFNLTLLDCALIKIGDRVLFGPNVSLITATHPSDPTLRGAEVESALPITIGDNVWLSSNVTVLPGVTIGSGSVIGAGSVINKNIPPNSVVVGIPGKVVKVLKEEEHGLDVTSLLEKRGLI
ncbi:uncharacterized protein PRCAT00000107001 [Priceomyces carsonii]|uniref:uncharacterized protein n=1 Tax=Priceomyces carsonii TaxID=28549 RepID=UPI002ED8ADB6|nr:unnamed protein product [Priceomyces carsonii]